jgi:hypothetical protein
MSTTPPAAGLPPVAATPKVAVHSTLETILADLETATEVLAATGVLIPGFGTAIAGGAAIALKLEQIVIGAYNAHQAIVGKPMDLSILKDEAPV